MVFEVLWFENIRSTWNEMQSFFFLFGGHFLWSRLFFGQVCGNLGKNPSDPQKFACSYTYDQGPDKGSLGGNAQVRHFWWKEGISNGLSRMNLKLDLRCRFWLRLDLPRPYVWFGRDCPGLNVCPVPVSKMSRNFTSVKFFKLTPAWWCIVMK